MRQLTWHHVNMLGATLSGARQNCFNTTSVIARKALPQYVFTSKSQVVVESKQRRTVLDWVHGRR